MKPQFPSASSPQRLTVASPAVGNNLKKTPLRPGHSLMDWIRLTKSGADLRGTGQSLLKVTDEELAKHNRPDDCWMAIRGFVYNVTKYMSYHPGGEAELMRGAGKDATDLFNEIHRWVNFESMLKACLVGKLVAKKITVGKNTSSPFLAPPPPTIPSMQLKRNDVDNSLNTTSSTSSTSSTNSLHLIKASTEWHQTANLITIMCHINVDVAKESIVCDLLNNGHRIYATLFIGDQTVLFNIKFPVQLDEIVTVSHANAKGTLNIALKKAKTGSECKNIEYLDNHCNVVSRKSLDLIFRKCRMIDRTNVTHDTDMYRFELPKSCYMQVPVGSHIYLQTVIDDITIARPYTVIISDLTKKSSHATDKQTDIYLMIKHYKLGSLTPFLYNLKIGDAISLSSFEGTFKVNVLDQFERLVLFCAGTGFTPMIRLIFYALYEKKKSVKLHFFNKKKADILWKSDLDQLEENFIDRFKVNHVLSDPDPDWSGLTGRITSHYIEEAYRSSLSMKFTCVCGPPLFTRLTVKLLKQFGIPSSELHVFTI